MHRVDFTRPLIVRVRDKRLVQIFFVFFFFFGGNLESSIDRIFVEFSRQFDGILYNFWWNLAEVEEIR